MRFRVTIRKPNAKDDVRTMEGESRFAVYKQVQQEGGTVIAISSVVPWLDMQKFNINIGTGISRRTLIVFTKNIAAMLTAGLSLNRALSIAERQASNKHLKKLTQELSGAITSGLSFHESLAQHPAVFSKLYASMVKAGEESGGLSDALNVVALQMERSDDLSRKVKGAMIYPSIVITAMVIVLVLMLIFVVPTLTATFVQLHVKLPIATQIIIALSDFVTHHIFIMLILLVSIVVGGFFFIRSARGKDLILTASLYLPVIGELVRETYAARASRTLASLLTSGVNLLSSISITEEVVSTKSFSNVLKEAEERVRKGEPLSTAFNEHHNLYPLMMSDMISVGEETGKLSEMLKQVADYYENDVQQKTKDLSTIIEPVLMLAIGAFVGVFAVSMIAPIYSLSSAF